MSSTLRDRATQQRLAEAYANGDTSSPTETTAAEPNRTADLVPFGDFVLPPTSDDPPEIPVIKAWARVMRDLEFIGKNGLYNAAGTRYNFRGVDAVINAFGPVCRKHGVAVIPTSVQANHAAVTTTTNKAAREATVTVAYRIWGPAGDFIAGEAAGEALDHSDKGAAKAQSVALRVFLTTAGLVPTDRPDPDDSRIERGERPLPKAADYVEEICDHRTRFSRIRQIYVEVRQHNLLHASVTNEFGDPETLESLMKRKGDERQAEEGQS